MTIAITNGVPTALEPLADETKQLVGECEKKSVKNNPSMIEYK